LSSMFMLSVLTYLFLVFVNKFLLDMLAKYFGVEGKAFDIAIVLAAVGVGLEFFRFFCLTSEDLVYLMSALNYVIYYVIAFFLIQRTYGLGFFWGIVMWLVFCLCEVFFYVTLSMLLIPLIF